MTQLRKGSSTGANADAPQVWTASDVDELTRANAKAAEYCRLYQDVVDQLHRAESSRRDWAAEADRQTANAEYECEAHQRLLHDYDVLTLALAELWGDKSKRDFIDQVQRDSPYRPGPTLVIEDDGTAHLEGPTTACACVTDEQAAQLGPRFSRPVCAVHEEGK